MRRRSTRRPTSPSISGITALPSRRSRLTIHSTRRAPRRRHRRHRRHHRTTTSTSTRHRRTITSPTPTPTHPTLLHLRRTQLNRPGGGSLNRTRGASNPCETRVRMQITLHVGGKAIEPARRVASRESGFEAICEGLVVDYAGDEA